MSLLDGQGRIDRSLYPNFAALADGANWYRTTPPCLPSRPARCPPSSPAATRPASASLRRSPICPRTCSPSSATPTTSMRRRSSPPCAPQPVPRRRPRSRCNGPTARRRSRRLRPARVAEPVHAAAGVQRHRKGRARPANPGPRVVRSLGRSERPRLDFIHLMLPHGAVEVPAVGPARRRLQTLPRGSGSRRGVTTPRRSPLVSAISCRCATPTPSSGRSWRA